MVDAKLVVQKEPIKMQRFVHLVQKLVCIAQDKQQNVSNVKELNSCIKALVKIVVPQDYLGKEENV